MTATVGIPNETRQYVLFRLGDEEYGLPVSKVSSIIRYEQPTPVPQAPSQVDGVINVRGRVIPVLNLRRTLSGGESCALPTSRIVVTESDAGTVGVIVDSATEVATIPEDVVMPAPESVLSELTANAFEGVVDLDGRLVILLYLENLVPKAAFHHDAAPDPTAPASTTEAPGEGATPEGDKHA